MICGRWLRDAPSSLYAASSCLLSESFEDFVVDYGGLLDLLSSGRQSVLLLRVSIPGPRSMCR